MGLFDRFRAQPKWKHSDPAVRLAAIEEIALEDQALLESLARDDRDARVRRAAVRKLYDPALLEGVAERDQDADVRSEAVAVLSDLALGAFEDSSEAESLKALDHLHDARHIMAVAKQAAAEAVSMAALSRLTDSKALGSVARRAIHASTRLEALGRLADTPDEVLAIAVRADHRDVALAALERLTGAEQFRIVAAKSAHKAVVRRAKALLKAVDDAEQAAAAAAVAAAPPKPSVPDWKAMRDRIIRTVEDLGAERDWRVIESRVASAEAQWSDLAAESEADEARTSRFAARVEAARQASVRLREQEAERAERVEQAARDQAERVAICERVEALAAALRHRIDTGDAADTEAGAVETVPSEISSARTQWSALSNGALAGSEVEGFDRRFARACQAAEREIEQAKAARASRARMQELVDEAERLVAEPPAEDGRVRWNALKQEWTDLGGRRLAGHALADRMEAAATTAARRDAEAREHEQRRQNEHLQRVVSVCERVEAVAKSEPLILKEGERALRDAKSALDSLGGLGKKDRGPVGERLRAAQTALFPRVHELREADEWVRWANVGVQEDLCRRAEALGEVADASEAAQQLRELQQQWKRASAVPRDKAQGLWERFKKAGDEVHARAETHFARQAVEREQNLARKEALCQQAEALAESSDWIKTAEAIKRLQAEWTAVGAVPRGHEKAIWERFRGACDKFFTRRRDDLNKRKEEWTANLARKEALIAQVEALVETTDWSRAVDEVKRLQAEWKTVGPVRKARAEELWQRFRGACGRFFERFQQRDQIQVASNVSAREEICRELEALVAAPPDADTPAQPAEGLRETVQALRTRWQQAPTLMPRDTMAMLTTRFNDAVAAVARAYPQAFHGSDLDLEAIRRKAEALCERVEQALPAEKKELPLESPTSILAARLREALAANTIGGVAVADQDAPWREASTTVKDAQAAWTALAPLPAEIEQAVGPRFQRACKRFFDAAEKRRR